MFTRFTLYKRVPILKYFISFLSMWNLLFLFFLISGVCTGKSNEINKMAFKNEFSKAYSTRGILNIPYAEIHEPFMAWYDSDSSSRIDYYGGMVKTYQLKEGSLYGNSIKIVPITNEEVTNDMTCLLISGSIINPVKPQSVLPDIKDFKFAGKDLINGLPCDKWTKTESFYDKTNKYTMWTLSKKIQEDDVLIPVRYEMKGMNSLMGSHYDHYYIDYEMFSPETPSPAIFSIKNYTCREWNGPASDHIYTFNPMKEFIHNYDDHVHLAFRDFKKTHKKDYKDELEHTKRLNLFRQNLRFIHSHNRKNLSYKLAVNHLADRDDLEMKALRGRKHTPGATHQGLPFPYSLERWTETPESIDWRLNGAVTPIKDQSVCGSCWSFGTTGAVEGAYFLKHNKLLSFSEQALVDCSWGFGNNGCDGGEDFQSYDWIMKHGIPTEDAYGPYLGQDGYCHIEDSMEKIKIKGYVKVTSGDWRALRLAVAIHGPVSVAIDASHRTFSFYSNGVYYDPHCGNTTMELDHAVLVVGYGKLNGEDYWLVKNSWSNYWGNDGYILMSPKDNNCGVTTDPTYVLL